MLTSQAHLSLRMQQAYKILPRPYIEPFLKTRRINFRNWWWSHYNRLGVDEMQLNYEIFAHTTQRVITSEMLVGSFFTRSFATIRSLICSETLTNFEGPETPGTRSGTQTKEPAVVRASWYIASHVYVRAVALLLPLPSPGELGQKRIEVYHAYRDIQTGDRSSLTCASGTVRLLVRTFKTGNDVDDLEHSIVHSLFKHFI